jgi:molybdopterin-containing oxidoreductase family membrane subunit
MYFAKQWEFERFILLDGGIYTAVFWVGQVFIGGILPLVLLFMPCSKEVQSMSTCLVASLLVILGGIAQMYVTIVGGQAFPLVMFPGHEVQSSFYDGVVTQYSPSVYEWLLGLGGIGVTFLLTVAAVRVFKFLPQDDFKALQMRRSTD